MHVLHCDRCHLEFFDYQGYEEVKGEGTVCLDCIIEAEDVEEELQKYEKKQANPRR